jgi:uncharacterized protein involved in exopolysaccharide biosynthesis
MNAWRKALGLAESKRESPREQLLQMAVKTLKVRAQPNTRLVEVSVDSVDPIFAAAFANALTAAYIEQNLESRLQSNENTGQWLSRQMVDIKIKLEKAEDQLQSYARTAGLQLTSEKENVADEKLRQLQQELSRAQADRIAKQSKYELAASSTPDVVPEVLDNAVMKDYELKLADLRRQIAEASSTFTPAHPKVLKLEAQRVSL